MKCVNDFRLRLGKRELVPIVIGGMGVDISSAELALEGARLGGIGHMSDAMAPTVSDRRFHTRFVSEKAKLYKYNVANSDKSAVQFDLAQLAEATHNHVSRTMEARRGDGLIFINCMEKLTMNGPRETLRVRLRAALNAGHSITVHCTITRQQVNRPGYLEEFLQVWSQRTEVEKVWFSLYTPQVGECSAERLLPADRLQVVNDLLALRLRYPKLTLPKELIEMFATPPESPQDCVFARVTSSISADLTTKISPCQFGGVPDCSNCGCTASVGLAAIAKYRVFGFIPVGSIFKGSTRIGEQVRRLISQNP